MKYTVTKQFGSIQYTCNLGLTETISSDVSAVFIQDKNQSFGVPKHDDEFLPGDGSLGLPAPMYNGGLSFATLEEIDLRSVFNDGNIIEDLLFDVQRVLNTPVVEFMYNIDPSAEIFESIIVTTDPYPINPIQDGQPPLGISDQYNLFEFHSAAFRPMKYKTNGYKCKGMGTPESILFMNTRVYKHDNSRQLSGPQYTSYSEPAGPPTILYTDLLVSDDIVRGYPDFISAPTLYVYRVVSSFYNTRSPLLLTENTVNLQTAKLQCIFPPLQFTMKGNMRKGTESERIMKATDSLLNQPSRPNATRL